MPYKRKYKKRTKRRPRYRRRALVQYSGSGLSQASPLPKVFKFKTKYVETQVDLNAGVGGLMVSHLFSCNGLFDPNITGGGHQPLGFDQLMPMYDHYRVIGSRIRATFSNHDTTYPQIVGIHIQDNTVISEGSVDPLIENGMTRWTKLATEGSGGSVKTISQNFSTKAFFSSASSASDKYVGTIVSNPTEQAYFRLFAQPDHGNDTSTVRVTVEIEYIALLTEPRNLTQS